MSFLPDDPDLATAEIPLVGDGLTPGIVRIGTTVRRPRRPFTTTIHAYLRHLHDRGFDIAPEPLGFDDSGREILTFVAMFDEPELVAHADYCPGNVVFREGSPYGLIDFDLARPTTRMADAINALSWWAPLLHPSDRPSALVDADMPARVVAFAEAYGMTREQRSQIVPLGVRRVHNTHLTMRAAADVDPVFRRWWDEGVKDRMPRAERWWADNADAISSALR